MSTIEEVLWCNEKHLTSSKAHHSLEKNCKMNKCGMLLMIELEQGGRHQQSDSSEIILDISVAFEELGKPCWSNGGE